MKINKKKATFLIFFILLITSIGFFLYKNPHIINQYIPQGTKQQSDNEKFYQLQNQIYNLKKDLSQIPNYNTKADASSVAILEANIKKLEHKISTLEDELNNNKKATSKNALILTSANMIKNNVSSAKPYTSELFLLQNLSSNNKDLKEDIATIKELSSKETKSDIKLIDEFNQIYNQITKAHKKQFEENQKSTIKTKLDNFLSLKKINKNNKSYTPDNNLEHIKTLVNNKNFLEAKKDIQKINIQDPEINKKLNDWKDNVLIKERLLKAINNIIAKSIIAINLESYK